MEPYLLSVRTPIREKNPRLPGTDGFAYLRCLEKRFQKCSPHDGGLHGDLYAMVESSLKNHHLKKSKVKEKLGWIAFLNP